MYRLYDDPISGNGYKVRLALTRLGLPFEYAAVDVLNAETRTPAFLAKNPNGRIPVLRLENGTYLPESNAILWYLSEGTELAPADRLARARTLQWMFFEQYSHEPYIAVVRYWLLHAEMTPDRERELPERKKRGFAALDVMERHLAERHFFVGDRFGLADIALYPYTHVAPEGGFDLEPYPNIRAWLARVAAAPGHISITTDAGVAVRDAA